MKFVKREKVEWKDGAVLFIERVSRERVKDIEEQKAKEYPLTTEQKIENEKLSIQLEAKRKELKITPDEKTRTELEAEIEALSSVINENGKIVRLLSLNERAYESVVGWENIVDGEGNEVPYSEADKNILWQFISRDTEVMGKIYTFMFGLLGNLPAGLISQSTTDGTLDCVAPASKNV